MIKTSTSLKFGLVDIVIVGIHKNEIKVVKKVTLSRRFRFTARLLQLWAKNIVSEILLAYMYISFF